MVITAEHIATTIERIGTLYNELRDTNSSALPFVDRLHGVMLASELYDIAGQLDAQREETLSSYFGENSLRQNLQNIVLIEDMQRELSDVCFFVNAENADAYAQKIKDAYSSKQLLSKLPVIEGVWGADRAKPNGRYKFKTVFNAAHEDLAEPQKLATLSVDPSDRIYNTSIRQNLLEYRLALKVNNELIENTKDGFVSSLSQIYKIVNQYSACDIINELQRALEMLRVALMRDAQDIHFIRTGNFSEILTDENKQDIEHYYTELPLHEYFAIREEIQEEIQSTIDIEIDQWRIKKGYTGRKLTQREYLDFLNEQEEDVLGQMKNGYPELWVIREHSGGLNEDVTPENFARMFFRRKDVDRQFLELQWKHELILDLIKKTEQQKPSVKIQFSPEEAAVKQLIDNANCLAQVLYEEWHGKKVLTGVHQPEVLIEIKQSELSDYLDDMKKNHFEELSQWCYPSTANNKQNFVKFVADLRDKGFFGRLPNNLIAPQLAPIIGLAVGTATNYLSVKD